MLFRSEYKPGRNPTPSCWRTGSLLRAQGCLLGEAALGVSAPRPGAKGGQGQPRVAPCLRPSRRGQRPCRSAWSRPCCVVKPRLLARQAEIPAHAHFRPAIGEALLGFVSRPSAHYARALAGGAQHCGKPGAVLGIRAGSQACPGISISEVLPSWRQEVSV